MKKEHKSLENRLFFIDESIADRLIDLTTISNKKATSEYYQWQNIDLVKNYLRQNSSDNKVPSLSGVNKEPTKVIVRGIKLFGNNTDVKTVLTSLNSNEGLYLLPGLYFESLGKEEKRIYSPFGLICTYIQEGIKGMAMAHNTFKNKPTSYGARKAYETKPTLPQAGSIGEAVRFPEIVKQFEKMFKDEIKDVEIGEKIGKLLEGLNVQERMILSTYFRQKQLGEFYIH